MRPYSLARLFLGLLLTMSSGWSAGIVHPDQVEVEDIVFKVQLDPSVRHGVGGFYTDGKNIVIHLHSHGRKPSLLIDARTGQEWGGDIADFHAMRQVYDYDSGQEKGDSYLLRLGCGQWSVCTSFEDADFILMAREGREKNQLEFRLLDFEPLLSAFERALSGDPGATPRHLSALALEGLAEASRTTWRARLRDAMRSIRDLDRAQRLKQSPWFAMLRDTNVMTGLDASKYTLQYEVELAECRAKIFAFKPALPNAQVGTLRTFAAAVEECNLFYPHIVDWLHEGPQDMREQIARSLGQGAATQRSENLSRLAMYLGYKPVAKAPAMPPRASDVPGRPIARSGPNDARPVSGRSQDPSVPGLDDATEEIRRVSDYPVQIQLVAFDERNGLKLDESSISGTIFTARVADQISDGQFSIEAFNRPRAPIQMRKGKYRVLLNARLSWSQVDRCEGLGIRAYGKCGQIIPMKRNKQVEFILQPEKFRNAQTVSYGRLLPRDLEQSGMGKRSLDEVRLVLELQSIKPM